MSRAGPRLTSLALLWGALVFACTPLWGDESLQTELTAKLPDFQVLGFNAEFAGWSKVRSAHFVFYTDASVSAAKEVAGELEAVAYVCEKLFSTPPVTTTPVLVVLPCAGSEWRQLENRGGYEWRVAASVFGPATDQMIVITYDWQRLGRRAIWSAAAKATLARLGEDGPFWFTMGFGNIFREAEFDAGHLLLRDRGHDWERQMRNGLWFQWGRFFAIDASAAEFQSTSTVERYLSQASVLVHYTLFEQRKRTEGMRRWRAHLRSGGAVSQSAFVAAAGEPLGVWARRVWDYATLPAQPSFDFSGANWQVSESGVNAREMRELFALAQILARPDEKSPRILGELESRGLSSEELRRLFDYARGRLH